MYAAITEVGPAIVERICEILELRAADEQQPAMRGRYLAEIAFPDHPPVLEVGAGSLVGGGWTSSVDRNSVKRGRLRVE